jgi:signal transduction histidine kinase
MNTYWQRLGRSDAISRVTLIVVVLVQTSGSFITSLVDYTGRVPEFLLVRVAAFSAMFLVLGIGKLILKSSLTFELKPFAAILFFVLASVSAVFVDDTLLQVMHFTDESRFFRRLGLSLVGLPIAMTITALIVTGLREYTTKNQSLVETTQLLLKTRNEAEQRIAERKAELFERIEGEVGLGIESLNAQNSNLSQQEMKSFLDDVVRPLSYQLDRDLVLEEATVTELPQPKVHWRSVFSATITQGNPFHPLATTAWPTLTSTSFVIANFGPIGFVSGLLFFTLYAGSTWIARKLWSLLPGGLPTALRAVLMVVAYALIGWAGSFALRIPADGLLLQGGKIYFWIIFTEVVAWTVALLFTANGLLHRTTHELTSTNDELKREVIALNSALRQLQRGISRVLHGPVQQAIAASIYRLQSSSDIVNDSKVIDDLRLRISEALNQLKEPEITSRNLSESFAEIEELWSGVADITVDISQADLEHIQANPQATHAVYELVSEACVNAIKHGEPSLINFTINVHGDQKQIHILKTSDGKPLLESSKSGLGTQLLNEMCLSWKRYQLGELVALEMVIPLYDV